MTKYSLKNKPVEAIQWFPGVEIPGGIYVGSTARIQAQITPLTTIPKMLPMKPFTISHQQINYPLIQFPSSLDSLGKVIYSVGTL